MDRPDQLLLSHLNKTADRAVSNARRLEEERDTALERLAQVEQQLARAEAYEAIRASV